MGKKRAPKTQDPPEREEEHCHFCEEPESAVDFLIKCDSRFRGNICLTCVGQAAGMIDAYHRMRAEEPEH